MVSVSFTAAKFLATSAVSVSFTAAGETSHPLSSEHVGLRKSVLALLLLLHYWILGAVVSRFRAR
jgi:hypothetical protein